MAGYSMKGLYSIRGPVAVFFKAVLEIVCFAAV